MERAFTRTETAAVPWSPRELPAFLVKFSQRKGRIRSAERVEAHPFCCESSRNFFQPEMRTTGGSLKGVRHA
jgi:hypothetical protein